MARKKKQPEHVNHERWLVSYADFITLLFAFFTTLYAISTVDQKKAGKLMYSMLTALNIEFFPATMQEMATRGRLGDPAVLDSLVHGQNSGGEGDGGSGKKKKTHLSDVAKELTQLAESPVLKGRVKVKLEQRGVVVTLSEAGFFESGSAELRSGALDALDTVVAKLAEWKDLEIMVEGHTDNRPVRNRHFKSNWELSTARATFVVATFLANHSFAPERLSAAGYAEFRPVTGNDTPEGRARNRRIDVVVRNLPPSMVTPQETEAKPDAEPTPGKATADAPGPKVAE